MGGMPQLWGPARRRPVTLPYCLSPRNQAMARRSSAISAGGFQVTRCAETFGSKGKAIPAG